MRRLALLLAPLLLTACPAANNDEEGQPVPLDRFLFPTGLLHFPGSVPESEGSLVVASSNFNKRFASGSLLAVDLARVRSSASGRVGLPPFREEPAAGDVPTFDVLGVEPERQAVRIQSFAGELDAWPVPGEARRRLFVPTRAEGDLLHVVDFLDGQLFCTGTEERDCREGALSLTSDIEGSSDDLPRAPAPLGVRVRDDQVWVTHVGAADSPEGSNDDLTAYLVRLDADAPRLSADSFLPIAGPGLGAGAAHAVALGARYAYVSGRNFGTANSSLVASDFVLRLVDRFSPTVVDVPTLASSFPSGEGVEARGVDVTQDERRVYIATRNPEALLVLDVRHDSTNPAALPTVTLVRYVPDVPAGPSQVRVIERGAGQGPLVAVTCAGPDAAALALYDEDLGELTVVNVGDPDVARPSGLAVSRRTVGTSTGARLFVSNFGDGRVAVIDIPDLSTPQEARLVAFLGLQQQTQETVSEE